MTDPAQAAAQAAPVESVPFVDPNAPVASAPDAAAEATESQPAPEPVADEVEAAAQVDSDYFPVVPLPAPEGVSDEDYAYVKAQAAKDAQFRAENPGKPVIRAADPRIGGESF